MRKTLTVIYSPCGCGEIRIGPNTCLIIERCPVHDPNKRGK